ncbi:phosphatidylserine/phosphatidylglycerophosphate/cardiolipin synthase family protein [Halobacteriovorax sp. HLS]|uniref:phospholipase D-like domain-containing protein n=1 Tax=Halobacteriovorax sp. HLS TaxID=2234000 RepID=UPI000FD97058|nr:phospholipase D family protein [Halobacteriovorax sp. HLS]
MKKLIILIFLSIISLESRGSSIDLNDRDFNVTLNENHEVVILHDGYNALTERLDSINRAKHTIDLETFIWNQDISGKMMVLALIKKAQEGVKIRLLIDTFVGAVGLNPFIAHEMMKSGIEIKYYNPSPTVRVVEAQWRNHKKSMTIDNIETIVGGRNIGDEYFDLSEVYNFVDRDVFIKGPIVKHVTHSFESIWNSKESVSAKRPKKPSRNDLAYKRGSRSRSLIQFKRDLKTWNEDVAKAVTFVDSSLEDRDLTQKIYNLALYHSPMQLRDTCSNVTFASDRPYSHKTGKTKRILKDEINRRILAAKKSIQIESPYFILNEKTKSILDEVNEKGIELSLLTNYLYSTDAIYVAAAFNNIIKEWLRKGMKIFLYSGDTQTDYATVSEEVQASRWGTHAKSIVFDDSSIMIGSYNFDPRSYNFSAELAFFCNDNKTFARDLKEDMDQRKLDSHFMDSEDTIDETRFQRIGTMKRIAYYILKIPSTVFSFLL